MGMPKHTDVCKTIRMCIHMHIYIRMHTRTRISLCIRNAHAHAYAYQYKRECTYSTIPIRMDTRMHMHAK